MKKLSKDSILKMHTQLIIATGGEDGVRDESLLLSALEAPFHTFDGEYLYPTIKEKASRLGYGIIKNHPFVDGNKRIGVLVMLVFLEVNNIYLTYRDEELVELAINIAAGNIGNEDTLNWINNH